MRLLQFHDREEGVNKCVDSFERGRLTSTGLRFLRYFEVAARLRDFGKELEDEETITYK